MTAPCCVVCHSQQKTYTQKRHMVRGMCNKCYQHSIQPKQQTITTTSSPSKKRKFTIELPSPTKEANNITQRQKDRRLSTLDIVFDNLVGPRHTEEGEIALLAAWLKRKRLITSKALLKANIHRTGRISGLQGVLFKAKGGLPFTTIRFIKSFMRQCGLDVFPSEAEVRKLINKFGIEYESGVNPIPYIHILKFWELIRHIVIKKHEAGLMYWWAGQDIHTLYICISLDKGGIYTKLQLIWMNHSSPQTEDASFILGFYQGDDKHDMIARIFRKIFDALAHKPKGWCIRSKCKQGKQVEVNRVFKSNKCSECGGPDMKDEMAIIPDEINITKVKIVYGGDMMSLFELLGLNGPTAAFPCISCEVDTKQMKDGITGEPRTLERMKDQHSHYDENKSTDPLSKSCADEAILRTSITNNIVPIPLHLFIGLVNTLYEDGEAKCKEWDRVYVTKPEYTPFHNRFHKITREMNVRIAQIRGGELTGNGCSRLLGQHEKFKTIFTNINNNKHVKNGWNHEEWTNRFIGLIEKLHQLHLLIMRPTPLCQHEINNVQSLVLEFGVLWRNLGYSVTPKVHQLEIHVPLFLQHHHTIGMCSEQSLEHQHKTFNRFDTMYRTMRNVEDRLRSTIKQSHLQSTYDVITHI